MSPDVDVPEAQETDVVVRGTYGEDWLSEQLPGVLAADPFMRRFLRIFQDVADTVRWPADHLEHYVTTSIAPMEWVRWLGKWLSLEIETSWDDDRQRSFVADIGSSFQQRGTRAGLEAHLRAVTGGPVLVTDTGGVRIRPDPATAGPGPEPVDRGHATISVATTGQHSFERLRDLVSQLMPADTIFELVVEPTLGEPASEDSP